MEDFLNQLNSIQKEAVINFTGPALVIAGAGSGKTRVLTYRIAYMLSKGIRPSGILALTFTNKAANEMKERIAVLVGDNYARQLWMGTFHSIFARILRFESKAIGYPSDYTIYDSVDSKNLIKTIIKELKLDDKIYRPNEIMGRISFAKNNLITPDVYASNSTIQATDSSMKRPLITDIYTRYSARCKKAGAMDFDDLLLNTNILLRDNPNIQEKYMNAFTHILVDEYQDTNYSQYLIIKRLSQEHKNICVVGDDAQSIYSFRGARIENILKFQNDNLNTRLYKLERNYRSTKNIVNAANSLISQNKEQISKKVYSENDMGDKVEVMKVLRDNDEGEWVSTKVKDISLSEQLNYSDFAILYRTNAQSRIFEESLRRRNIPYKIYGGISFFQRKEIKDVLAYFKYVINPKDDEAFKRIINYPKRGIGKTTVSKLETLAISNDLSIWEVLNSRSQLQKFFNTGTLNKLFTFLNLIKEFRAKTEEMEAFDLAYTIATTTEIMKDLVVDKTPEGISRYENLEELLNGIKEFTESEEQAEENSLSHYLQTITLYTDADKEDKEDFNRVTLMTIHAAKGLEFDEVFIVGMEEELFPSHMSSASQKELEEERRLFYVALTRAKKRIHISYADMRYKWGLMNHTKPSRFLKEINEKYLNLPDDDLIAGIENDPQKNKFKGRKPSIHKKIVKEQVAPQIVRENLKKVIETNPDKIDTPSDISKIKPGVKIRHQRFGRGKIESIDGSGNNLKASVAFDNGQKKQLLLKFAKLEVIG